VEEEAGGSRVVVEAQEEAGGRDRMPIGPLYFTKYFFLATLLK
jgi:hypothetical protein